MDRGQGDADPGRVLNWPSRNSIRKLTHHFVTAGPVFFWDILGRDDWSPMNSPAGQRSTHV